MSRIEVRDILRSELELFLSSYVPAIPFYDSIDQGVEVGDDLWVTCEFTGYFNENLCYGDGKKIETGICDVYIFGRPGIGDNAVVTLAGQLQLHLNGFDHLNLVVTNVLPPSEQTHGSAMSFYGVSVSAEYSFLYP